MKKLKSLSIFFPFFNDAGTVRSAIEAAYRYGRQVTDDLEVIAIHGGNSTDNTWSEIQLAKKKYNRLVTFDKSDNTEGYAVIKYGFKIAKKEWVFYTDGDLQYDIKDVIKLVDLQQKTHADVVNGYKTYRADNIVRVGLGNLYRHIARFIFKLPIRDITCDFRLIRSSLIKGVSLKSRNASILPEMIKKLQHSGAKFAETPVTHRYRIYGKSNYTGLSLLFERIKGDYLVYRRLTSYNKPK